MAGAERGEARARQLAPAKVNPTLFVLGRRDDGYHDVDTTLLALDLCDEVEVSFARAAGAARIEVEVRGEAASDDVPRGPDNLAARAALAALDALAAEDPRLGARALRLRLTKRIPSQAGLGGGSSDAVAAFRAVERLSGRSVPSAQRGNLLARLGADCVFFDEASATGAARATGIGERVEPLAPPRAWHVVVVTPDVRCPTAATYAALRFPLPASAHGPSLAHDLFARTAHAARASLFNHLERAALAASPGLVPWRDLLDSLEASRDGATECAAFLLSGSGASWFALAASPEEGAECLARVRHAARARGLALRGAWVLAPAGFGSRPE